MRIKPLKAKTITAEGKILPLFAIVDDHGHTVIQTVSIQNATTLLDSLSGNQN